ncbi:hypothetical protein Y032_0752g2052 [Ancylostoma ceylanicum]|uniref:Uncharacterized protein n=1 Tax=Ancylostoma ceylanicum TaxID=53326 RepID=A0A016WG39_9BILA|nr:hypothetical protein Y032_0752g2052 [Ancylostoma ceylanicum]
MLFSKLQILIMCALFVAVHSEDPCRECTRRGPHACCTTPSGRCCWIRKKRTIDPEGGWIYEPMVIHSPADM